VSALASFRLPFDYGIMCGMTQEELERLLDSLLAQWENEVVEFKRAGKGFSTGEIGEYFSALSNEANLACCPRAWLVFGIDNKTRKVVGTDFDASSEALNRQGGIKFQITQGTDPGVCFNAVHDGLWHSPSLSLAGRALFPVAGLPPRRTFR
jgi:predicted HTH transcriptional regulator